MVDGSDTGATVTLIDPVTAELSISVPDFSFTETLREIAPEKSFGGEIARFVRLASAKV